MTKLEHTATGYCQIHLDWDEWGNELMEQVAMEYFRAEPSCQFVLVHEHAGWCLGWRRDGSIWGTANDSARPDGGAMPEGGVERVIRRETEGSDYWLLGGKSLPALRVVA